MEYKYGIDFGTTNSSIALHFLGDDDEQHTYVVEVRRNQRPRVSLPSVFFIDKGQSWAGEEAKNQLDLQSSTKIPRNQYKKRIKMDLEEQGLNLNYEINGYTVKGVDLIAKLFKQLKDKADISVKEQGLNMDGVVMGVPVAYNQISKNVLIEALYKAGFYNSLAEAKDKTEFVSEPLAVAIHYGLDLKKDATVMIFDFGGGTLDLAIVNLKENIEGDILHPHETLGTARRSIGGEELNRLFFINSFCKPNKYGRENLCKAFGLPTYLNANQLWEELLNNTAGIKFIENVVERCKIELSERSTFRCSFINRDVYLPEKTFYRDDFTSAIRDILDDVEDVIDECLEKANIDDPYDIDSVLLAGGSSLIPAVQDILTDKFGNNHVHVKPDADDEYVVENVAKNRVLDSEVLTSIVRGLARVGYKENTGKSISTIVECDFGIWDADRRCFAPIIERGTKIKDTYFDKISHQGISIHVKCSDPLAKEVEIPIFQRKYDGSFKENKLGVISIPHPGGKQYRIFMTVDEDTGMLEVIIYDIIKNSWIEDIPLQGRQFSVC